MKKKIFILIAFVIFNKFYFAQSMSSGKAHSIFLCNNSIPYSCGLNYYGELGDGTNIKRITPVPVVGMAGITAVSAGEYFSLFLKNDSTVWSCGNNPEGQLGDGTTIDKTIPVQIIGLSEITAISAGHGHSLYLKKDGTVWACGRNSVGQLGVGTTTPYYTSPIQVSNLTNIVAISSGGWFSLFLKNDGTVWVCGINTNGQLGQGTTVNSSIPIQITSLSGITAIEAGQDHSIFLKNNGTVWSCGLNDYGAIGVGTSTTMYKSPIQVSNISGISKIAAGSGFSLFLHNDGTVWGCGINGGNLGNTFSTANYSAIHVYTTTVNGITNFTAGESTSFFLKNNGTVLTCGSNQQGQLGVGTTTQQYVIPVQTNTFCTINSLFDISMNDNSISLYPNPASTILNITTLDDDLKFSEIEVSNYLGQIIIKREYSRKINISNLSNGYYNIKITDINKRNYSYKFVKE